MTHTLSIPTARLLPALAGLFALLPGAAMAQVSLRNLTVEAHVNEYPPTSPGGTNYSACWSYIHHDGREYAVIGVGDGNGGGTNEGTAIYNVTNPASPYRVAFIPGPPSIWREMKQYRSWIYVVTEGTGANEGIQIIRMTDPENPVLAATYTGAFHRSHTVSIDTTRAILVCNGTRVNSGNFIAYYFAGTRILSLASPEAPVEISHWPVAMPPEGSALADSLYIHDSVPVGNRLYASSIAYGIQRVFDFTNPSNPVQIASWTYPGGFTHNSWPDATGDWLYVTDEKNGEPLKIFDISNLAAPVLFNTWTSNETAIVHNVHVKGTDVFLSNYTEGIRVLDGTDPGHPAEFAHADTWAGASGDFNGVWEVCPYYPSGTIVASDRNSGLWVYRAQRNYGLARVTVVNGASSEPLPSAKVYLDNGDSLTTTSDGVAVFAPNPGSHDFTARAFGHEPSGATRTIAQGGTELITLTLAMKPTATFSGSVRSAVTQSPLEDAGVDLEYTTLHGHTNAAGQYSLGQVPVDFYRVVVRRPAYIPLALDRQIGPSNAAMDFQLVPAPFYTSLETAPGWSTSAPDDNALASGRWTLVDPLGTKIRNAGIGWGSVGPGGEGTRALSEWSARPAHEGHREAEGMSPGPVQPENDRSPVGVKCFVTGQGTDTLAVDQSDVDFGRTTLISPALDLTGKAVPMIGYWRWFYTSTPGGQDVLAVSISNDNGASWVPVETSNRTDAHWAERTIPVSDYVTPNAQVRLRFVAADEGGSSVVEAAIDDIIVYDGAVLPVGALPDPGEPATRLRLRGPWPNPANGVVRAVMELPRTGRVVAEVMDVQGRKVASVFDGVAQAGSRVIEWNGTDDRGRSAEPGVYFLVAHSAGGSTTTRFVRFR